MTATLRYESDRGIEVETGDDIHDEFLHKFVTLYRSNGRNLHVPRERVVSIKTDSS
jgi:hypothetical protein